MRRSLFLLLCTLPVCLAALAAQDPPAVETQALLAAEPADALTDETRLRARSILLQRAGVLEGGAQLTPAEEGLRLRLPGEHDQHRLDLFATIGELEIRWLRSVQTPRNERAPWRLQLVRQGSEAAYVFEAIEDGSPVATEAALADSPQIVGRADLQPGAAEALGPLVLLKFSEEGAKKITDFTRRRDGHLAAVVLDGEILSVSPVRRGADGSQAFIPGAVRNETEARLLAAAVNHDPLPVPLTVRDVRTVPRQ